MTAKEYLVQARTITRRIEEARERVSRLRAQLEAGRLMGNPERTVRGTAADWTDRADDLIELEKRICARIRELCHIELEIMDVIEKVEDPLCREVLELYYLDGLTWEKVAERMGYSVRNVQILHGKALREVRVPW